MKLAQENFKFERLMVRPELAEEMFKYNKFKREQIPLIMAKQREKQEQSGNGELMSVYKVGNFVDISSGPMISNTSHIGRFQVTALHNIETSSYGLLQRLQGVALPTQLQV